MNYPKSEIKSAVQMPILYAKNEYTGEKAFGTNLSAAINPWTLKLKIFGAWPNCKQKQSPEL